MSVDWEAELTGRFEVPKGTGRLGPTGKEQADHASGFNHQVSSPSKAILTLATTRSVGLTPEYI